MDFEKVLLWSLIGGIAVLGVVLALLIGIDRRPLPESFVWEVIATQPLVIGTANDAFSYTGAGIRTVEGRADLRVTRDGAGFIDLAVRVPAGDPSLNLFSTGTAIERRIELRSLLGPGVLISHETPLYGDTGIGQSPLPQTRAVLYAQSLFQGAVDGQRLDTEWIGEWSVADALRRADGSIGQRGLVFSPLLRDKTGFSDPSRLELTLILRVGAERLGARPVDLQIVFRNVEIVRRPDES